ncbi:MAG: tetratricopeptide repeat protein, partial [Thermoplasmata archaeon]|nr:tetratricopeptide repeat protein [Thermoplasmata archaeon]
PGFELDFITREGYVLYLDNSGGNATTEGVYNVHRELSKPLLFTLILFVLIFIIISGCWIAFLFNSKKYYDRLHEQKIEELAARYKVEPFTIEDVFLVYSDGTLITHQTRRLKTLDDDIFMGMLTSIKDFIKDAMSPEAKGELNELSYGKLKILIEHGAYVFLAAVVSGKPPGELRKQMKGAVKRIHQTYLDTLRSWDGNIGKLEPAKKIIVEMILKESKGTGKIQRFDKRSANAWNDKGVVLIKIGNLKEAISCFDRAIKINPNVSDIWSNKGIVLYKLHKYERAMRCFDKALQLNPYNKKATTRREKCWYKMQLKAKKTGQRLGTGGLQDQRAAASTRQVARSDVVRGTAPQSMPASRPMMMGTGATGYDGATASPRGGGGSAAPPA